MAENYFDPAEDEKPVARDNNSADASKGGVRAAWDAWTSKPENNAALLQFGIAMMNPRSQSQTGLGHFANAIGEGAEASTRNIAAQNLELDQDAKREERLSTAAYRGDQGYAARTNANAYADAVAKTPGGAGAERDGQKNIFRVQADFRRWKQKPEDTTGMMADPILGAVQKKFPNVKTKADLVGNDAAERYALELFARSFTTEAPDPAADPLAASTTPPAAAQPAKPGVAATPTPAAPITRRGYDARGVPTDFQWDGTKWIRM